MRYAVRFVSRSVLRAIREGSGAAIGFDVFVLWEYSYGWAHFLTYGLDKDWLLAQPDLLEWDILAYFCGVTVSHRLTGGRDYLAALKSGDAAIFEVTMS